MVGWMVKWVVNVVTVLNVAKWMKAGSAERSQPASTSDRLAIIGPLVLAIQHPRHTGRQIRSEDSASQSQLSDNAGGR